MPSEYQAVLPCKPGDDYWWVSTETLEIHHVKGGIKGVVIYQDKPVGFIDESGERFEIKAPWCCLSLEEAEAARNALLK